MRFLKSFKKFVPFTIKNLIHFEHKIVDETNKVLVMDFLKRHYYPHEPLNVALDTLSDPNAIDEQNEMVLKRALDSKISFLLLNAEDKVISVLLATIETDFKQRPISYKHPLNQIITNFYHDVFQDCMIAKKHRAPEKFIDIDLMCVDMNYIGKELSQRMVALLKKTAEKQKIKLMTFICTSNYTGLSAIKAGFYVDCSVKYVDYKVDGKQVFHTKPPHHEVQIFALTL